MSITKKQNQKDNLANVAVSINDSEFNSRYFRVYDVPEILPAGKSAFKIDGSNLLKPGSEVKVEVIDIEGNVVYSEYPNFLEGSSRFVSIYVYPDTPIGKATITIIGEAINVSDEWKGHYNVKWQKTVLINPYLDNTQPIRFLSPPSVNVQEFVKPYRNRLFASEENIEYTTGLMSGLIGSDRYTLVLSENGKFDRRMIGSTVTVPSPKLKSLPNGCFSSSYQTTITDIVNETTAIAEDAYQLDCRNAVTNAAFSFDDLQLGFPPQNTSQFLASNYTMSFQDEGTFETTENYRSFALVTISDMDTFSGDIHSIKLYMKSVGSIGEYELVTDSILEEKEAFVDNTDDTLLKPVGTFEDQTVIDDYWTAQSIRTDVSSSAQDPQLIYTSSLAIDSMFISGSPILADDYFAIQSNVNLPLYKDVEYTLSGKLVGIRRQKQTDKFNPELFNSSRIRVFISGSGLKPSTTSKNTLFDTTYGKEITVVQSETSSPVKTFNISENFTPEANTTGSLTLIVDSGEWHVSNLSVKASQETGFNPGLATFIIPIPDWQRNDTLKFRCEFYDINGTKAIYTAESAETSFAGGNLYVGGGDNLLTGSFFMSNTLFSGIEMSGENSAFLRSVGYVSYNSASRDETAGGFMLWSGSVLKNFTDEYEVGDVGFEFHGGFGRGPDGATHAIRFRTSTGVLEITGSLNAETGKIGGWTIGTSSLFSDTIILDSDEEAIIFTTPNGVRTLVIEVDSIEIETYQGLQTVATAFFKSTGSSAGTSGSDVIFDMKPTWATSGSIYRVLNAKREEHFVEDLFYIKGNTSVIGDLSVGSSSNDPGQLVVNRPNNSVKNDPSFTIYGIHGDLVGTYDENEKSAGVYGFNREYQGTINTTSGSFTSSTIHAGVRGHHGRGLSGGIKAGVYGSANDQNASIGVLGEARWRPGGDTNSWSGVFRYRPFLVGNPFTGSYVGQGAVFGWNWVSNMENEHCGMIVYPPEFTAVNDAATGSAGSVGIGVWLPQTKLHVNGTISASNLEILGEDFISFSQSVEFRLTSGSGGGGGGSSLWTSSADYISRLGDVYVSGSLNVSSSITSNGLTLSDKSSISNEILHLNSGEVTSSGDFVWDYTNNRLGVGTGSPSYNLEVSSVDDTKVYIQSDGGPANIALKRVGGKSAAYLAGNAGIGLYYDETGVLGFQSMSDPHTSTSFPAATQFVLRGNNGRIGVNTDSPVTDFHVVGDVSASNVYAANLTNISASDSTRLTTLEQSTLNPTQSKALSFENPTDSENITMFYLDTAITIQKVSTVLLGTGTPAVSWSLLFDSSRNNSGTNIVTEHVTTTTGSADVLTSFDDATVPANNFVWLITTGSIGTTTEQFHITLQFTED